MMDKIEKVRIIGAREWRAVGLGLAGVVLGYVLVHLYDDHRDLHKLFDMVNQAQRQQQTTAPVK